MAQRRVAREAVLQGLYAWDVGDEKWTQTINTIIKSRIRKATNSDKEFDRENFKFAEKLFLKVVNNHEEIDDVIKQHIKNWRIERLNTIDLQLMRIAIAEFLYFEQIPTKVTMNEAIEIAKEYSTKKSSNFVNGILDSALQQLQEEGRINKKGRGLIETSLK